METILHSLNPDKLKDLISEAVIKALEKNKPQKPIDEDQLLKIDDIANLLSVSKATIHNWKKSGLIPFHRISNKIYFKKSEVYESLKKAKEPK